MFEKYVHQHQTFRLDVSGHSFQAWQPDRQVAYNHMDQPHVPCEITERIVPDNLSQAPKRSVQHVLFPGFGGSGH